MTVDSALPESYHPPGLIFFGDSAVYLERKQATIKKEVLEKPTTPPEVLWPPMEKPPPTDSLPAVGVATGPSASSSKAIPEQPSSSSTSTKFVPADGRQQILPKGEKIDCLVNPEVSSKKHSRASFEGSDLKNAASDSQNKAPKNRRGSGSYGLEI